MKRFIIAFIVGVLSLTVSAQNHSTWIHHGIYPLSQCYGVIEMSDGNLAVREAVFDDNQQDIGYNLYKISIQGELLDSLFIESHTIDAYPPILRDPQNANSNIMTSFYKEGDVNYYHAIYINDNLEITNEIEAVYYDNCNVPSRSIIDSNNDIICRSKIDDDHFCLVRMGLDGTLKSQSDPITATDSWVEHPIFEISSEPLKYGYMSAYDNMIAFDVYDEDFNCILTKTINNIEGWKYVCRTPYDNACRITDGSFVVTMEGSKLVGTQIRHQLMAVKFNSDIEVESVCKIGEEFLLGNNYPQHQYLYSNLGVTDNNIYLVWQEKKERWEKLSVQTLFVTCLDMDMNLVWEEPSVSVLDHGMIANFGVIPLSNGGVASSGWLTEDGSGYYSSKDIYAVMFDNHLSTTEIESAAGDVICYPNPTTGIINVTGENIVNIEVVNIMGQTMLNKDCDGDEANVDISSLVPGIYLIKARTSDGTEFSERVVKE